MPSDRITDQAEGLRRLLVRASTRVITITGARTGLGTTTLVANLATSLARGGKKVLVLDESPSYDNVGNMLNLKPRYDLLNAIKHDKTLQETILHTQQGVSVLPVARAIQSLPQLSAIERRHLLECLAEASRGTDVVLVDAATSGECYISSCLAPEQPLLVVLGTTAAAITESYALIKRMALQDGRRDFQIVVNRTRGAQEAEVVFGNVAQVAKRHLHVHVEYLGYIPADDKLGRTARLSRPAGDAFPASAVMRAIDGLGRKLVQLPAAGHEGAGSLSGMMQRLMRQAHSPDMAYTS